MKLPVLRVPGLRKRRPLTPAPPGASPGTLVVDPEAPPSAIHVLAFGPDMLVEEPVVDPEGVRRFVGAHPVTWVNVDGLGDGSVLQALAEQFDLHPLAVEDVLNVRHRAKMEEHDRHLFVILRIPSWDDGFDSEQVSLCVGSNFVITFQERPGDCLDGVRKRIRDGRQRIRSAGPDYLAYAIVDSVIDAYFPVLEAVGERLEDVENRILERPGSALVAEIQRTKHDMLGLRRTIWPHREFLGAVVRNESELVDEHTRMFFRDAHDHAVRIVDLVDTYREVAGGLMDLYLSVQNNRMSDVMKVLTIMASVFIPLTFIAGIYGMNFDTSAAWNMPELAWRWGYPAVLLVMAGIAGFLMVYFRRRGWIGESD